MILGVDPAHQRSGVGGALVTAGLEGWDAGGIPVWVDTAEPQNLAWYGRLGFEVDVKVEPGKHAPPVWTMTRPARHAAPDLENSGFC